MALQLARNCTVQAWDGEVLVLALEPAHAHLLGSLAEERLKDALGRLAGRPIRLRVAVGEVSGETPAQRADRASAERRAAAVEAMRSDGVVQALAEQFDARLVEESVAPVDDAPSSRTGRD